MLKLGICNHIRLTGGNLKSGQCESKGRTGEILKKEEFVVLSAGPAFGAIEDGHHVSG